MFKCNITLLACDLWQYMLKTTGWNLAAAETDHSITITGTSKLAISPMSQGQDTPNDTSLNSTATAAEHRQQLKQYGSQGSALQSVLLKDMFGNRR